MKVFGHPASTCTRKVLCTLAEKNHQAEFVIVDVTKGESRREPHISRQPFGKVPVLDHDGFMLYESRAIIRYLDLVLPGTSLTPSSPPARGLMEQWMSVEGSYFTSTAMKIIYQLLFNRAAGKEPDMAVVEAARAELTTPLNVLESALSDKQYLCGDQFSLADICYLPYIEYLFMCGQGDLFTSRKNVAAWWERTSSRPSWKQAAGK